MTTFLPLKASWVWTLVGAPQAVPSASSGAHGTYMKVVLGICSPLEIACFAAVVEKDRGRLRRGDEVKPRAGSARTADAFAFRGMVREREDEEEEEMSLLVAGSMEVCMAGRARAREAVVAAVVEMSLLTIFAIEDKCDVKGWDKKIWLFVRKGSEMDRRFDVYISLVSD